MKKPVPRSTEPHFSRSPSLKPWDLTPAPSQGITVLDQDDPAISDQTKRLVKRIKQMQDFPVVLWEPPHDYFDLKLWDEYIQHMQSRYGQDHPAVLMMKEEAEGVRRTLEEEIDEGRCI